MSVVSVDPDAVDATPGGGLDGAILVPEAARIAGLQTFERLQGLVTPLVLANAMCRAIAAELIKAGRVEALPAEMSPCTFGGPAQSKDLLSGMTRLGAAPSEVFGTTGLNANDKVLPDEPSYRQSANMPFGRPQAHLREWQHEIDTMLDKRHHRTMRYGAEPVGAAPPP